MATETTPRHDPGLFTRLFDTADDLMCIADLSGRFHRVNPSWTRVLGWDPAEIEGRPYSDLVHPDDIAATQGAGRHLAEGGTLGRFVNRYRVKGGGWRHLEWSSIVADTNGLFYAVVRDVTDARRMKQRLADALRATGAGQWEWNIRTGERVVSDRWSAMLGYAVGDLPVERVETWRNLVHPDDLPMVDAAIAAHIAGETETVQTELRLRHRDGHWVWVLDSGRITTRTDDGEAEWLSGTFVDISRLHAKRAALDAATEALRARETLMASVFAQSPVGLALADQDTGHLLDANPALLGPLGYGRADLPTLSLDDLVPPEERVRHALLKAQLGRDGSIGPLDGALCRRDGSRMPITGRAALVADARGRQMALWVIEDVTERYRLEAALRRKHDFMEAIVDTSISAIMVTDEEGRVEFANAAAEALVGGHGQPVRWQMPCGEALQVLTAEGTPMAPADSPFRRVAATGLPEHGARVFLQGMTGARRVLSVNAAPLVAEGEGRRVVSTITDITEQTDYARALEDTVRDRTAALEAALETQQQINQFQRRFISVVSHEFRTPLAIIDGSAHRVERLLARGEPDRTAEYLTNLRGGVQRLTGLLETMLETARLQEGAIDLSPEPMLLNDIIAVAAKAQAELHPEMTLAVAPRTMAPIVADPRCVRQIIDNMLSNAIKYSGDAKTVRIETDETETTQTVTVHDSGVGVAAAELPNIFKPFFRASTAEGLAGSGLGLSLSRTLARLNGGDLAFASEEGCGSRITLTLTRAPASGDKVS